MTFLLEALTSETSWVSIKRNHSAILKINVVIVFLSSGGATFHISGSSFSSWVAVQIFFVRRPPLLEAMAVTAQEKPAYAFSVPSHEKFIFLVEVFTITDFRLLNGEREINTGKTVFCARRHCIWGHFIRMVRKDAAQTSSFTIARPIKAGAGSFPLIQYQSGQKFRIKIGGLGGHSH